MEENVRTFLKAAEANPELRERMTRMDAGQLAATAREMGFELTDADFQPPAGELGENDLGNVAGGGFCICPALGGGGGTDDTNGEAYLRLRGLRPGRRRPHHRRQLLLPHRRRRNRLG